MARRGVSLATRKGCKSVSKRRGQALAIKSRIMMEKDFDSRLRDLSHLSDYGATELLPLSFPWHA